MCGIELLLHKNLFSEGYLVKKDIKWIICLLLLSFGVSCLPSNHPIFELSISSFIHQIVTTYFLWQFITSYFRDKLSLYFFSSGKWICVGDDLVTWSCFYSWSPFTEIHPEISGWPKESTSPQLPMALAILCPRTSLASYLSEEGQTVCCCNPPLSGHHHCIPSIRDAFSDFCHISPFLKIQWTLQLH